MERLSGYLHRGARHRGGGAGHGEARNSYFLPLELPIDFPAHVTIACPGPGAITGFHCVEGVTDFTDIAGFAVWENHSGPVRIDTLKLMAWAGGSILIISTKLRREHCTVAIVYTILHARVCLSSFSSFSSFSSKLPGIYGLDDTITTSNKMRYFIFKFIFHKFHTLLQFLSK